MEAAATHSDESAAQGGAAAEGAAVPLCAEEGAGGEAAAGAEYQHGPDNAIAEPVDLSN